MKRRPRADRFFLILVILLSASGFFIFSSASLGWFGKTGVHFAALALKQLAILVAGLGGMIVAAALPYRHWRRPAFWLLVFSIVVTMLVFVPGIGVIKGGASRWLSIFGFSFQPAELLKFSFVIYLAAFLSHHRNSATSFRNGLLPIIAMLTLVGIILMSQPDTDTFVIIIAAALSMFLVAGGKWRHVFLGGLIAVIALTAISFYKPYIKDRLITFFDRSRDVQRTGWQINQSLIAIGSGGITGRGFGQGLQKFNYLPEPTSDSIFAVAAEEFGFVGATGLVTLFLLFGLWGLRIASRAPDEFGRLLTTGFVILIMFQSFMNIASMLGLVPLAGTPLVFVSQGGSALLFALIEAGVILNVSRFQDA